MGKEDGTPLPNDVPKCTWKPHADKRTSPHPKIDRLNNLKIKPNILHTIGNTPLVRLNTIPKAFNIKCEMYAKCEFLNPGGSVKDRISLQMIEEAEKKELLNPNSVIVEPTAGNTGIGMALVAAIKGYKCVMVMMDKTSVEKQDILKALGSGIELVPGEVAYDHPNGIFGLTEQIVNNTPNGIWLDQMRNSANPLVHYETTAMELYNQCDGKIDMVVNGAGTGGTLTGVGRRMKELCPNCVIVGADPAGSKLAKILSNGADTPVPVEVEGIGRTFIPTCLDKNVVNEWVQVTDEESFAMSRRLVKEEGLLCGGSSGTAMAAAIKAAAKLKEGQRCVVILPDTMQNYLTKHLSDQWLEARGFKTIPERPELWWWQQRISTSGILKANSIKSNVTCQNAIEIMEKRCSEYLSVIDTNGFLLGVVSILEIMTKFGSGKICLTDDVNKVTKSLCTRISAEDSIGKVARVLEIQPFVIIVQGDQKFTKMVTPMGMINRMDLMKFIMLKPKSA